jgi:hypothetical protein
LAQSFAVGKGCCRRHFHAAQPAEILEIFQVANELQQWIIARQLIGRDITG